MIEKLLGVLPEHKDYLDSLQGKVLYVADWKDENNGGISFTDYDVERAAVRLLNPSMLSVFCDKFPENALPIKKGCFSQQCECILFPQDEAEDTDDWRLFIETKYAKDEAKARDERNNYPQKMVGQIEATVEYFRNKGILEENQVVYAIVSFPMLDNYNAWFDQNLLLDALVKHHIIVRASNKAKVISKKVLAL